MTRRRFFGCIVRWTSLAALSGLVGRSALRALGSKGRAEGVGELSVCGRCQLLRSCRLPEAARARAALGLGAVSGQATPEARGGTRGLCGRSNWSGAPKG